MTRKEGYSKLFALFSEFGGRMNDLLFIAREEMSEEDFNDLRHLVALSLVANFDEVYVPILKEFPDLAPPGMDWFQEMRDVTRE
jgi:hypothetical protein